MHVYYDVKDMLHKELEDIAKKGELSAGSLDTIDKLLHSIKNACKIIMYEEYTDDGYSYADADMDMTEYSNARGRTGNVKRDSRGRYSRTGGRRYPRGGYSYDGGHEEKIEMLRSMMDEVSSDDDRRALKQLIRRMEQN